MSIRLKHGVARSTKAALVLSLAAGCPERRTSAVDAGPLPGVRRAAPPAHAPDTGSDSEADRLALFAPAPFAPRGRPLPEGATALVLRGEGVLRNGQPVEVASLRKGRSELDWPITLEAEGDTFLAQVAGLLGHLADARAEIWLVAPGGGRGVRVHLSSEADYQRWLAEPTPGRVRVIQRADGFEVMTAVGKVPGHDPNGPAVPQRGGAPDLQRLHQVLLEVQARMKTQTLYWLPSYGTAVSEVARAITANDLEGGGAIFGALHLVYPSPLQPRGSDGG